MDRNSFPSDEYYLLDTLKGYLNFTPNRRYPVGIGDDAAIRNCERNEQLILTADILVENVHFSLKYMNHEEIGYKAMVANISDCSAMGAEVDAALIQIVFPADSNKSDIEKRIIKMYTGIQRACTRWKFPIVGGDLSSGPCWVIAVSLTGRKEPKGRLLKRRGLKIGDDLWVSGIPGMSEAGLDVLKKWGRHRFPEVYKQLVESHIAPYADIDIGLKLSSDDTVHAAIDLSDGISKECYTLCFDNNAGIALQPGRDCLPASIEKLCAIFKRRWYHWFLYGGEDYKLLFAASKDFNPSQYKNADLHKIGEITDRIHTVVFTDFDGSSLIVEKKAWDHVRKK